MHDPVANLDVVLLERHAVHLASGARDGGPAGGGEGLALGHVREGHRALDDVVLDDVGQRLVRHEVHLGGAELLGELDEGVVVGAEDGDGARAGQEALAVGLADGGGEETVVGVLSHHAERVVAEGTTSFLSTLGGALGADGHPGGSVAARDRLGGDAHGGELGDGEGHGGVRVRIERR